MKKAPAKKMAAGKMPMAKDPKTGKSVPEFAVDGKGKMKAGGSVAKKAAGGKAATRKMGGGMMKKKGYAKGGAMKKKGYAKGGAVRKAAGGMTRGTGAQTKGRSHSSKMG